MRVLCFLFNVFFLGIVLNIFDPHHIVDPYMIKRYYGSADMAGQKI